MGRMNEDVVSCKGCSQTIVYEPENEKPVCGHCGAVYVTVEMERDKYKTALEECMKVVRGEIKHINQQARLLHIYDIVEQALSK